MEFLLGKMIPDTVRNNVEGGSAGKWHEWRHKNTSKKEEWERKPAAKY